MSKNYVVLSFSSGSVRGEVLSREEFMKRISPRPGSPYTDLYYGGDWGITFVSSMADLIPNGHQQPVRLLVYEVGEAVIPTKIEAVTKYLLP